jgi:hypothetical protein
MGEKNVCVMYPNSHTSVILGQTVISELANLAYFIPDGTHEQAAFTCYEEVKLASAGMGVSVTKITGYEDLASYDYLIFPNLDVNQRKSRKDFATMCRNLFR